jgi:hypothetical protein
VRFVSADDIWLSPFTGRDTAVISSIVQGNRTAGGDPSEVKLYDSALQEITFDKYMGRPHPGKLNYFTAAEMRVVYPHFDNFVALRASVDPTGMFMNDKLEELFGGQQ